MSIAKVVYWILWIPVLFILTFSVIVSYFGVMIYYLRLAAMNLHEEIKKM